MAIPKAVKLKIQELQKDFDKLRQGKEDLLTLLDEAEIPESVYNSNAIENSTLTLQETEQILLEEKVSRDVSLREVYEAKNLARVAEYIRKHAAENDLTRDTILFIHQFLIGGIDDTIAGRFRTKGEYVRVGTYIAPAPEHVESAMNTIIAEFSNNLSGYALDKIAKFHLDFETVHPFNDGNGRMGRVMINYQLGRLGLPSVIIRDRDKKEYYQTFKDYYKNKNTKSMEKVLTLAVMESLHRRIAYLKGEKIITVTEYASAHKKSVATLLNAARRQTIPAFREKGRWMIGEPLRK